MAESYLTQIVVAGAGGLDLRRTPDEVNALRYTRLTNVDRTLDGSLTGRAGMTSALTAEGEHHTINRLDFRDRGTYTFIVGAGTSLYAAPSGAMNTLETGFSGEPMVNLVYHPPISSESWLVLTEGTKMRKTNGTLSLPLGLALAVDPDSRFQIDEFAEIPPPVNGPVDRMRMVSWGFTIVAAGPGVPGEFTTYGPLNEIVVDNCDSATGWVANAGTGGAGATVTADTLDKKEGGASLKFTTDQGAAIIGYYNFYTKEYSPTVDLSTFGTVPIEDDDIFHIWLKTDTPEALLEFRVYIIVAADFDAATLPATDPNGVLNSDFYVKSFRPNDFTPVYEITAGTIPTADVSNATEQTLDQLPKDKDNRKSTKIVKERKDKHKKVTLEIDAGSGTWSEHGILGVSLKRGDFSRVGTDSGRDWSTVTGICVVVSTNDDVDINCWMDDLFIRGGAGLDTSLTGMTAYDYRYINYDPRTGAKSNPSSMQNPGFQLDSLRQAIILHPLRYGNVDIHQRFFRRGGTLQNQWYFLGENSMDGETFTDTLSDLEIAAADTLEIDNDQPVTTLDPTGKPILHQPLKAIFGPLNDLVFGCGDPHRAGDLYWCKPTEIDHWPSAYHVEACSPSEELMQGALLGSQAYVFSRQRGFSVTPNLLDAQIVTVLPCGCLHGLVSRLGICTTPVGIAFVADDGIYRMAGGPEENISDNWLFPLFHGQVMNGYQPIDFTHPEKIRLVFHDDEIHFKYQAIDGSVGYFIYSIVFNFWRAYAWGRAISGVFSDQSSSQDPVLYLGGFTSNATYSNTGVSDDGVAISCVIRSAALDQGFPREDKLYGDIIVDAATGAVTLVTTTLIQVTAYFNNENDSLTLSTIPPIPPSPGAAAGVRERYYISIPDADSHQGRNISIEFTWASDSTPPVIYKYGPSYTPQADTIETRITNWDPQGTYADKWIKGLIIDGDTGGLDKQIDVYVDGVQRTGITFNGAGRRVQFFSFPQVRGRLLRLVPTDSVRFKRYQARWIFDEEPLALLRWETQEVDHGIPTWHTLCYANVSYRACEDITLDLLAYNQDGTQITTQYTLPGTFGVKTKLFLPFAANQGVLFKYLFTSEQEFWLYREETEVMAQPWGTAQMVPVKPFGSDDLDQGRQVRMAGRVVDVDRFGFSQSGPAGGQLPPGEQQQ